MAAASLLPPLLPTPPRSEMTPILPTPPRSTMLPLLPTPSGVTLLLSVSAMPGRADFVQKWDSIKKYKMACSPASSSSSFDSDNGGSACRADTVERWDVRKKYKISGRATSSLSSSDSGGSPLRAESVERWDTKKLVSTTSLRTDRGLLQDGNNKRPPSRASSAERWDLHKKHRPEEKKDDLCQSRTEETTAAHKEMVRTIEQAAFAGQNLYASPEPCMLPMPSFLLRAH